MFLDVEGKCLILIYGFIEAVFVSCLCEAHFHHRAAAFRCHANAMRVQMSLTSTCIATIDNIIVGMRIHSPNISAKPKVFTRIDQISFAPK